MPLGLFITLEGGEGVGKTTQAALLAQGFVTAGHDMLATREPGGTESAERLRLLLLDPALSIVPLAEALAHFAARADHVARVIRPALEAGKIVICDRFSDSTMAYQGLVQGVGREPVAALARLLDCTPNLTLILDVPAEEARSRLLARGQPADRYEDLGADFACRVAAAFRAIAKTEPERCVLIDGVGEAGAVQNRIRAVVHARTGIVL